MTYPDAEITPELSNLSDEHMLAFAALVRHMVAAGGGVTDEERVRLDAVTGAAGERFWSAIETAGEVCESYEDMLALAQGVAGADVRELLYVELVELATARSISAGEANLLRDLERIWGLKPRAAQP